MIVSLKPGEMLVHLTIMEGQSPYSALGSHSTPSSSSIILRLPPIDFEANWQEAIDDCWDFYLRGILSVPHVAGASLPKLRRGTTVKITAILLMVVFLSAIDIKQTAPA